MASFGDGVEGTPGSVATVERSSISAPVDLDTLLLQGEEYYKSGKGDSTRECGGSNAERKRAVSKVRSNEREGGHVLVIL